MARAHISTGCRCREMSVRRWSTIFLAVNRMVGFVRCSCAWSLRMVGCRRRRSARSCVMRVTGRGAAGWFAPVAAYGRDRPVGRGRVVVRDRAGAAAHESVEHRDLREGRSGSAANARASVAIVGSVDMSPLAVAAADYLRVRRALGYKLGRQGRQLLQFVAYLDRVGASTVTIEHAVAWATQPAGGDAATGQTGCRSCVSSPGICRRSTRACEVPPKRLLPCRRRRPTPYLYAPAEIEALMLAAGELRGSVAPGDDADADRRDGRHRDARSGRRSVWIATTSTSAISSCG